MKTVQNTKTGLVTNVVEGGTLRDELIGRAKAEVEATARANQVEDEDARDQTDNEVEDELADVVGPNAAAALRAAGVDTLAAAKAAPAEDLLAIEGIGQKTVDKLAG